MCYSYREYDICGKMQEEHTDRLLAGTVKTTAVIFTVPEAVVFTVNGLACFTYTPVHSVLRIV